MGSIKKNDQLLKIIDHFLYHYMSVNIKLKIECSHFYLVHLTTFEFFFSI